MGGLLTDSIVMRSRENSFRIIYLKRKSMIVSNYDLGFRIKMRKRENGPFLSLVGRPLNIVV